MPQQGLPTITDPSQQQDLLKNQNIALSGSVNLPSTPVAPWNFSAKSQRGGIFLSWSSLIRGQGSTPPPNKTMAPADGYEIQRSDTGDFSAGNYLSIPVRDPAQITFFDSLGGAVQTKYYRIRATNGTASNPYSVHGIFSGVVKQSSIDASDTATTPTTARDTFTSDATQARAKAWRSGTQYPTQR